MAASKIIIEDYSPQWQAAFLALQAVYLSVLGNLIMDIQHVGSTAVPGLAAKPILDIDLIIENKEQLPGVIRALAALGYVHQGDFGIKEREAFQRQSPYTPVDGSNTVWMAHHLYVCPRNSVSLKNHLSLRDYLRKNQELAARYGELKKSLADQYPYNIDKYVEGKTAFITAILKDCGFVADDLKDIALQNKAP